ncbi:Alpha/Beta hydrolase protein [Pelagophyceae sp. CCMP2097]|nr:Alpha/Beta hydrolase protein [Pelagophyceae sp. CCMP2097]
MQQMRRLATADGLKDGLADTRNLVKGAAKGLFDRFAPLRAKALPPSPRQSEADAAAEKHDAHVEALVEAIVRPRRAEYGFSELGPTAFVVNGRGPWRRDDFTLTNARGHRLHGSWWHPVRRSADVVVYLHANASSRIEAIKAGALSVAVSSGCELVAFDFAGSGWSDGETVSLGAQESLDVADVVAFLERDIAARGGAQPRFVLWGRAMGATAAALHCDALNHEKGDFGNVRAVVLDSVFVSVSAIVDDLVLRGPSTLQPSAVRALLDDARPAVFQRTQGADVGSIDLLEPQRSASSAEASDRRRSSAGPTLAAPPALLFAARRDAFLPPAVHTDALAARLQTAHLAAHFDGAHSTPRPLWVRDAVETLLRAAFAPHDSENDDVDAALAAVTDGLAFDRALDTVRVVARADAAISGALGDAARNEFDAGDLTQLRVIAAADRVMTAVALEVAIVAISMHVAQELAIAALATEGDEQCDFPDHWDHGALIGAAAEIAAETAAGLGLLGWSADELPFDWPENVGLDDFRDGAASPLSDGPGSLNSFGSPFGSPRTPSQFREDESAPDTDDYKDYDASALRRRLAQLDDDLSSPGVSGSAADAAGSPNAFLSNGAFKS